ncbi:MAG: tol-pal system protein YbgF [Acidobacteria bacterium]|nr:tol-pal system protein YbgF [Acidobacteriota bacterium]
MKRYAVFFSVVLLFASSPAWAGTKEEIIRLQSDVLQLQNQLRVLQKNVEENGSVLKTLLEQLNDQVAKNQVALEGMTQGLQAQKADVGQSLGEVRRDLQNLSVKWDDTNNRIAAIHQKLEENQMRLSSLREVPSESEGAAVEPDQIYNAAYNDYLMGNYDLAIASFQDFLSNFRDSELSDNALYYLGVSFQNQGRYEQAIQAFDQVINLYPKGDKTPNAHYKKALTLQQVQKNTEAIEAFKKLATLYPESQEAAMARAELEKLGVSLEEPARRRR